MKVEIENSVLFRAVYDTQVFLFCTHANKSMLILQETTAYAPPCQSGRPSFLCNDIILHVRIFPGLYRW